MIGDVQIMLLPCYFSVFVHLHIDKILVTDLWILLSGLILHFYAILLYLSILLLE